MSYILSEVNNSNDKLKVNESNDVQVISKPTIKMSAEQLKDFLADIHEHQLKMETSLDGQGLDPRRIIQILKIMSISAVSIEIIEFTQAEKFLRNLIQNHGCDPFHPFKQQH